MFILENYSLKDLNTFHIASTARYYAEVSNVDNLEELHNNYFHHPTFILGGGSNILLTGNYNGLVIKNEFKGIKIISEDNDHVYVQAAAGENWHQFVLYCIAHGYAGIENLSLIPGNVGAAPMQNIGAYGVELKDVFHQLEVWHLQDKKLIRMNAGECGFGYRDSVFKSKYKDQFCILNVTLRLDKNPRFNISYGAIKSELEKMGVQDLSIAAISQAVINIRSSKLPDPAVIGNAGSFFKNPEIENNTWLQLQKQFPDIVGYPLENNKVKVAAGWLIENCGWKGFRKGDAGVHEMQALVLVNYGNASGKEIFDLSERILQDVQAKFGIIIEREVNII